MTLGNRPDQQADVDRLALRPQWLCLIPVTGFCHVWLDVGLNVVEPVTCRKSTPSATECFLMHCVPSSNNFQQNRSSESNLDGVSADARSPAVLLQTVLLLFQEVKMHYAEFKMPNAELLQSLIVTFPFAVIAINSGASPIVAQAPLTLRKTSTLPGAVEFHLARQNPFTDAIKHGTAVTIVVNGPSAHISPSWYTGRFPDASSDRSRAAPTWDYVSATLVGFLRQLTRAELETQIADLVTHHEPADGWRFDEIDPRVFASWCDMLVGYRADIVSFDLTAKLSQNQTPADRPGIATGLRRRAGMTDGAVATLVEGFDGTPTSVQTVIENLSGDH